VGNGKKQRDNHAHDILDQRQRAVGSDAPLLGASSTFEKGMSDQDQDQVLLRNDLVGNAAVQAFVLQARKHFAEEALDFVEDGVAYEGDSHLLITDPDYGKGVVSIDAPIDEAMIQDGKFEIRMEAIAGESRTTCIQAEQGPIFTHRDFDVDYDEVLFVLTLPNEEQIQFRDEGWLWISTDGIDAIGERTAKIESERWTSDVPKG